MVSMRLLRALRGKGVDARMLVMHKDGDSPYVEEVGPAWKRTACFIWEHMSILASNGFSRERLFKASLANCGLPLSRHPWVEKADVVLLAWVNQGMISLKEISRIKAPVAWAMHDMWCLTGVCHHSGPCGKYKEKCFSCPILGNHRGDDLSTSAQRRKADLYGKKKIHFVAVSNWLAGKCRESSLLSNQSVTVIPNVFHLDDFHIGKKSGKTVVMGAARLDDPIKGLDIAIDALNKAEGVKAVLFGDIKNPDVLKGLKIDYEWLGPISSQKKVAEIYAEADAVLSTSHYETLPGTLIEGMASGCVPVTFGQGGQPDIVDHLQTGYIASYPSVEDIAKGIGWALSSGINPAELRKSVEDKFSSDKVAERYISFFEEIIEKN